MSKRITRQECLACVTPVNLNVEHIRVIQTWRVRHCCLAAVEAAALLNSGRVGCLATDLRRGVVETGRLATPRTGQRSRLEIATNAGL